MSLPSSQPAVAPTFTQAQWRDAIHSTATELCRIALGFGGAATTAASLADASAMVGAHIPLVGKPSYELAFVTSRTGCAELASALLGGMDVSDLPPSAITDAICELVNMLAGGVKRRLTGSDLELGLPVFVSGSVEPSDRLSTAAFKLRLGAIDTCVIVIGPR
jgi:CheY-specific phosphatase CheX